MCSRWKQFVQFLHWSEFDWKSKSNWHIIQLVNTGLYFNALCNVSALKWNDSMWIAHVFWHSFFLFVFSKTLLKSIARCEHPLKTWLQHCNTPQRTATNCKPSFKGCSVVLWEIFLCCFSTNPELYSVLLLFIDPTLGSHGSGAASRARPGVRTYDNGLPRTTSPCPPLVWIDLFSQTDTGGSQARGLWKSCGSLVDWISSLSFFLGRWRRN